MPDAPATTIGARARVAAITVLVLVLASCRATTGATSPASDAGSRAGSATHAAPVPKPATPTSSGAAGTARSLLHTLPVKGRAPKTGYSREQFGQSWTDDNDDPGGHNGCDTRNDILRRDLTDEILKPGTSGCVLLAGTLRDPYTATTIEFHRGDTSSAAVQIDHVVALSDAWQTGAQQLTDRQRVDLANDPLELLAVDGPTNEQKGDGDAASWLPPNTAYRCAYVARQLAVKQAYHLWLTPAESVAIGRVLTRCPTRTVPHETAAPSTASSTASSASSACTTTSSGSCIRGGESCPQDSFGRTGHDAEGRTYVCEGDHARPHWQTP